MTRLTPLKPREVIRGLQELGFIKERQKGSHAIFHHPDCRRAPLPIHPSVDIQPYFLSDILKQLKIPENDILKAIGKIL